MAHQEGQLSVAPFIVELHRRGKLAQQRRHRLEIDVIKHKALELFGDVQHVMHRMTVVLQRNHLAFVIVQFDIERNMQRQLLFLIGGDRRVLRHVQRVLFQLRIVVIAHRNNRRARLAVPATELRKIDIRGIFHRLDKLVAGGGAAVVAFKVELHAFLEILFAQQRVHHANYF